MIADELNKAYNHLSTHDPKLNQIIKNHVSCNLQPKRKYFNALVKSIISQQLSASSANSILNKLKLHFNNKITPENILNTPFETLRSLGLSNAKANYIINLGKKFYPKNYHLTELTKI